MGSRKLKKAARLKPGSKVKTPNGIMTLVGFPEILKRSFKDCVRLRLADAVGHLHFFFHYEDLEFCNE